MWLLQFRHIDNFDVAGLKDKRTGAKKRDTTAILANKSGSNLAGKARALHLSAECVIHRRFYLSILFTVDSSDSPETRGP